jgi:hypothetical protein
MPVAIDTDVIFDYVLPEFEEVDDPANPGETKTVKKVIPEADRVVFKVKDLDHGAKLQCQKITQKPDAHKELVEFVLSRSLVGWENFKNAKGDDVAFKGNGKGGASPEDIGRLDPLNEGARLALDIFRRAFLEDRDRKNS